MAEDPHGYQSVIAEIPRGQLSERQTRIAAGLALIRDGSSVNAAAKQVGIPQRTLWRHDKGLAALTSEKGIQANEQALLAASFDIAQLAAEKITDRLLDETNPVKDADLGKFYGIASDKIAIRRGYARGTGPADEKTQDALAGALERLRQGDQVQITSADPTSHAIDVTHTSTDER